MIDLKGKPFYLTNEDIAWVEETLSGMTQDEKLRQLFCMIIYDAQEEYLLRLAREAGGNPEVIVRQQGEAETQRDALRTRFGIETCEQAGSDALTGVDRVVLAVKP